MNTPIFSKIILKSRLTWQAVRVSHLAVFILTLAQLMAVFHVSPALAEFEYEKEWGGYGRSEGEFRYPTDVATDSNGNVYVTDTMNNRIQRLDSEGTFQLTWGWDVAWGNGWERFETCFGSCQEGEQGSRKEQFRNPLGVAVDQSGTVYVADTYNDRMQNFVQVLGSYELVNAWNKGYSASNGQTLAQPKGVAVDENGYVYVADTRNGQIVIFETEGFEYDVRSQWGGPCDVDDYEDPNDCDRGFNRPQGIAVDPAGKVYVADTDNHRVQKFELEGAVLDKWGSEGRGNGEFNAPAGIATDVAGNVYVADTGNDRIQVFDSNGVFIEKWGSRGSGSGQFESPAGVAVDSGGNVYVADTHNNRVQKFKIRSREAESAPTPVPSPTHSPKTSQPSHSLPAPKSQPTPVETYDSGCTLKITSPRVKIGKSGAAKLSVKAARRLFTKGLKGYIRWGKVDGKNVACKKVKMAILEKRGKRYYLPGTKTRVSKKYLSTRSFPTKGARFFKSKKVGKLTQKGVIKKRRTKISFRPFSRKTKLGRRALKKLRKRKRGTYYLIYTAEVNGKTVKKTVRLRVRKVK